MIKTTPWGLTLVGYSADRETLRFSVYIDREGYYWTEDPDSPGEYCPCIDEKGDWCVPCK